MAKTTPGIRRLRAELDSGVTPTALAARLKCTTTTLYNILGGRGKPSLRVANKALLRYRIPTTAWGV